ncbi:hypothetical protein [Carnobacterium maltaromaticum]|uniref:hypothetical protein n=1 Tax=Carnobacterium maltaromaticum TaxID=2751 RepID=UPI00295E60B4|nr:hypothetical protein [Carnobacterium maltaromaticum]
MNSILIAGKVSSEIKLDEYIEFLTFKVEYIDGNYICLINKKIVNPNFNIRKGKWIQLVAKKIRPGSLLISYYIILNDGWMK